MIRNDQKGSASWDHVCISIYGFMTLVVPASCMHIQMSEYGLQHSRLDASVHWLLRLTHLHEKLRLGHAHLCTA